MERESKDPPTLGRQVGRGLSWSMLGQVGTRAGSFLSGIALARLLAPEDFGALAVSLVAVNLLGACNELGTIPAVVRYQGDVLRAARTGVSLAVVGSLGAYAMAFVGAPHLAAALGSRDATVVMRVLALTLVIDGVVAMPQALLYRSFRQMEMVSAEAIGMVVYIVVAVTLAATGVGVMSMAWGRLAGSATTSILYVHHQPFPGRPDLDLADARALLGFGVPLAMSHLLWEGVLNVDYLIVGEVLGPVNLGIYLLAFNLSNWPVSIVSAAVRRVSFAAFAQILQDRARMPGAFCRSVGVTFTVTVPLVVIIAVLAPELVAVLYGDRWASAASAVQLLVVLGGLRVVFELMFDLLAADGRPMTTVALRAVWLVCLVPTLWIGARIDGLRGAGFAHVLVATLIVLPGMVIALHRGGIVTHVLARQVARPLAAGACGAIVMLAASQVLQGDLVRLVVMGGLGAATYAFVVGVRNPLVRWTWERVRLGGEAVGEVA